MTLPDHEYFHIDAYKKFRNAEYKRFEPFLN